MQPISREAVLRTIQINLGKRAAATEWIFREIEKRFIRTLAVETGCVRELNDWGAGYMTVLLGAWLTAIDQGQLISVDNDPPHCRIAFDLTMPWSERVRVINADSVAWLKRNTEPIDFAYLDSMDTHLPGSAEHGLAEAQAVAPRIAQNGIIAFDDSPADGAGGWTGKGTLGIPWLTSQGWQVHPVSGYQVVLVR